MEHTFPRWADPELSADLPGIREAGEGPTVEFKQQINQLHDKIGIALAGLGTSGGGLVVIGVNDNCELVGINAPDGDTRDVEYLRIQGIVDTVRPALNYQILFGIENNLPVLAIRVSTVQNEPVFYYHHVPYVRDGRRSRVATPDEVKQNVWAHPSAEHARKLQELELKKKQFAHDNERAMIEAIHNNSRRFQ